MGELLDGFDEVVGGVAAGGAACEGKGGGREEGKREGEGRGGEDGQGFAEYVGRGFGVEEMGIELVSVPVGDVVSDNLL